LSHRGPASLRGRARFSSGPISKLDLDVLRSLVARTWKPWDKRLHKGENVFRPVFQSQLRIIIYSLERNTENRTYNTCRQLSLFYVHV
jgi:hypothetical protein